MHENRRDYLNHVMVAGLVGHRLAEAAFADAYDGVAERERHERRRRRRERMARVLRAVAAWFDPPVARRQAASAA